MPYASLWVKMQALGPQVVPLLLLHPHLLPLLHLLPADVLPHPCRWLHSSVVARLGPGSRNMPLSKMHMIQRSSSNAHLARSRPLIRSSAAEASRCPV